MNCVCKELEPLVEKSDRLRDLEEEVREYVELLATTEEGNPVTERAFSKALSNFHFANETYKKSFNGACKQRHIIVKFKDRLLNKPETSIATYLEDKLERETKGITYHCAYCDDDLFK
ncbi:MAG: hypothetical protein CMH62_00835 [Nanoarchaeota archaeon]|nr:hypothetical protein [Nanoarchaeota archaeon]|tara:strand:- start:1933 stop:2286 length:354 start_codon:yes stop_codon:yes gene_type:complete